MSTNDEWEAEVQRECIDKMNESAASVTIYSGAVDWKLAIEVGAAVLLDKPLALLVAEGATPPPKLALIADKILHVEFRDRESLASATREIASWVASLAPE